jgi:hypothetical protein
VPVDPLTTTALSGVGAWVWDKYGKFVTDKVADAFKGQWDNFKWKDAAEKYRAKIKKLYDTMQIMGMAEPVPLDDIFTNVYMLDKPTAFSRFDIEHLKQQMFAVDPDAFPHATRINGLRLVVEKGNLFILGKPGAGKTTFLKYIAVKAAEQLIADKAAGKKTIDKVPIFVSLKEWADSGFGLMPFIVERFDTCDFPAAQPFVEELLKSGSAIVLFDGLDEVNQESGQRDRQTRAMNKFIEKYDRTQYLITCRIAASDYSFQPFAYVEIADFTEKQIQTFVGNWFRKEGKKDEESCTKFLAEFAKDDNKGLRDLARTPLLLALLCIKFAEDFTFPQRRVEIYEDAIDALLKKWDSSRGISRDKIYQKLSLGYKRDLFARLAAESFEQNEYFFPQHELESRITEFLRRVPPHDLNEKPDGEQILKTIESQHSILVERAQRIYSFSHLTFQEYFTARYIWENALAGTLKRLIKNHGADPRWSEVFLLTVSRLSSASAGAFIKLFKTAVDEFVRDDDLLLNVLRWAGRKAISETRTDTDSLLARETYLRIVFVLDAEISRTSERFLSIALARALTLDAALGIDLDLAHARALAHTHTHNRDLIRDLNRAYARARSHKLNLPECARSLAALQVPEVKDSTEKWQGFADQLRAVMIKHRDIGHEWTLTNEKINKLASYFKANDILKSCLAVAAMLPTEKTELERSLYLPPSA